MLLIRRWAVRSQQGSRRNAMVAATELTGRRIERDEVVAYLADRAQRRTTEPAVAVEAIAVTR